MVDRVDVHSRGSAFLGTVRMERGTRRLNHVFEASCDSTPDAIAVECDGEHVTYRELDQRANRLAHLLIDCGVASGSRVGILLHRSMELYVALLATLKAGAVFVPIDPSSPADRIDYIAGDCGISLVLSTSDFESAASGLSCSVLRLDNLTVARAAAASSRPYVREDEDRVCYVIYTSGSTGRPKGVEVGQESICNFLDVVPDIYGVTSSDRVYQGMTVAFDFSIEEIWPTWARGATLVAGPTDSRRIGSGLAGFLHDNRVTVVYCTPTVLATIDQDLPRVRTLIVGGEACPAELVHRWSGPGRRMLNTYGPTEATVTATWCELVPGRAVTIGRPLPTYHLTLLDTGLRPVPDGEIGEICIGGVGVARRYVGRPDLTAERFLDDPRITGGGRLYRTGDLGRRLLDGDIEYLGRADSEVKVRGHRVDLQEIESVMLEDPAVSAAAVTQNATGDLIAYLASPGADRGEVTSRLSDRLRARLPQYMVPAFVEFVAALPLMPSGKVDRTSLPAPSGTRLISPGGEITAPRGEAETAIAAVWANEFGLEQGKLSVDADFFLDLGGHSLLAARTASALRRLEFTSGVSIADIYAHPTVRGLAGSLGNTDPTATAAPDRPAPRQDRSARVVGVGASQFTSLYLMLALFGAPVAVVLGVNHGVLSAAVIWQLVLVVPATLLLGRLIVPVLGVRLLSGGLAPGTYPLWSRMYVRLWLLQGFLAMAPLGTLSGSPLLPGYLRLLGARVGRRCHIATGALPVPALLDLGDDASIGYGAQLHCSSVAHGWVTIGPVAVGARAFVGANAVLEPGSRISADASLADMAIATTGQVIPAGEHWAGSPSTRQDRADPLLQEMRSRHSPEPSRALRAGYLAVALAVELLPLLLAAPAVALGSWALVAAGPTAGLLVSLLAGPVFVVSSCLLIAAVKRLVLRTTPTGIHPVASGLGLRKWVIDKLLQTSLTVTNSLYSTLYTSAWLRMLGARIGPRAEVSTVSHLDPDLLTLGAESFVADMASVGAATHCHGQIALGRTTVGTRSFIGNAALLRSGSSTGDESLVGVHTIAPADGVPGGTSWLGSPGIRLPRRQDSGQFDDALTFRPRRAQVCERLLIEFFRIVVPGSLIGTMAYLVLLGEAWAARTVTPLALVALAPAVALLGGLATVLAVAAVKWVVVGRYRPRVEPLWSRFVRRTEFVTALYETAAVPALLGMLSGTPMLGPLLRVFGATVGKRSWIATTYLTEFDLVRLGDDVTVGPGTSLQTHLFEDRVMKMSTLALNQGASVGARCVVLYDSVVAENAEVTALSLVMKGERLPENTRWHGIPSRTIP
ncbi:Pls/PosA family non-ribosomal peptide synthetase [Amycolatopsis sp. CA-230715]|uniref:Pls/PosA family non-ribosomal peptide synthetase n=1 Tax=Amycolatopsis sp. CA-230715 TaxID=2745196 RepID=UPI001C33AA40|nr:Pls/PosA family non-ribosomal peptide synthetase [Amycolatopsis sp. CA-230715]QWF84176.1 D-alanine--poly(phosphoribitol) ligase subunit 1 [Amycolatopsis sp. CA-230715]